MFLGSLVLVKRAILPVIDSKEHLLTKFHDLLLYILSSLITNTVADDKRDGFIFFQFFFV